MNAAEKVRTGLVKITVHPKAHPIGQQISRIRQAMGWTRDDLAKRSGWSEPQIQNIETGRKNKISLQCYEDCLQAMGWEVVARRRIPANTSALQGGQRGE